MRTMGGWLVAACLAGGAQAAPEASLGFGEARLTVDVAVTPAERQRGLMHREALPAAHGMLFVFPQQAQQCLWMKNTSVPLSAAFLDDAGRVVDLIDLQPHDLTIRCSAGAARFAVEANQGWFARQGVRIGSPVEGLPAR